MHQVSQKWYADMNSRETSASFLSGLGYQEQEREPSWPIFSRVMDFNFSLSAGITLSEMVSIVQEEILSDQHTSLFFLKDLQRLYQGQLKYLGADDDMIKNVNVTTLKE